MVLNNGKTTGTRDRKLNFVSAAHLRDDLGRVN